MCPTHGSLAKSGKVRDQTPKLAPTTKKKKQAPLRGNHSRYLRMLRRKRDNPSGRRRRRR